MSFRVVIVDDEPPARKKINHLLAAHSDFVVVGEAGSRDEALEVVERERPNVLFLDIELGGASGFDVLAALPGQERMQVIFVTAFDQFAVQAFRVQAVDYLLKPVAPDVFASALDRLRKVPPSAYRRRFLVEFGGRTRFVPVEAVEWFEPARNYVVIHCGQETHVIRSTLEAVQQELDPAQFARVNRSAIVNVDAIEWMTPATNGEQRIRMKSGVELNWSRRYISASLASVAGRSR